MDRALLLPAAEVLPHLAPGGLPGLTAKLEKLAAKARKEGQNDLAATLAQDREALEQGIFPAADRYLSLIYPELTTALDYLPADACVLCGQVSPGSVPAKKLISGIHWFKNSSRRFSCKTAGPLSPGRRVTAGEGRRTARTTGPLVSSACTAS